MLALKGYGYWLEDFKLGFPVSSFMLIIKRNNDNSITWGSPREAR